MKRVIFIFIGLECVVIAAILVGMVILQRQGKAPKTEQTIGQELEKPAAMPSETQEPVEDILGELDAYDEVLYEMEKLLNELPEEEPLEGRSEEQVGSGETGMEIAEVASESEVSPSAQDEEYCPTFEEIISTVGLIPPEETIRLINLAFKRKELFTEEELTTLCLLHSEISKTYFPPPERVVIDKRSGTTKYYLLPAGKYDVERDAIPITEEEARTLISQGVGTVTLH